MKAVILNQQQIQKCTNRISYRRKSRKRDLDHSYQIAWEKHDEQEEYIKKTKKICSTYLFKCAWESENFLYGIVSNNNRRLAPDVVE